MPVPRRAGCVRGRSCCSNGDVVLPAVRELSPLRDMWRRDDAAARTIQKYARKFNNALALASEMVFTPLPSSSLIEHAFLTPNLRLRLIVLRLNVDSHSFPET